MQHESAASLPGPSAGTLRKAQPAIYIAILIVSLLSAYAYKLRIDGIFACPGRGYGAEWHLAYCHAAGYGDFEHGAFWFNLSPAMTQALHRADVVFLGNSRLQVALSVEPTTRWFASLDAGYFLAGFSYNENISFVRPLLAKLKPKARVYVINLDGFFDEQETVPARVVMREPAARLRYAAKQGWQTVHRLICGIVPALCGNQYAVYRSERTGEYKTYGTLENAPARETSLDTRAENARADRRARAASAFMAALPVHKDCVVLTMVPTVDAKVGTSRAVARNLDMPLVEPQLDALGTFDGSHLDRRSAERWSIAFLEAAGPRIRACLEKSPISGSKSRP